MWDTLKRFADYGPYFLGVGMAQRHESDAARVWTLVGTAIHITLWTVVVVLDSILLSSKFNDLDMAYCHTLMLGAFLPLACAAVTVVLLTIIHTAASIAETELDFNDGHLPAFASVVILGSVRASHTFTLLLIISWIVNRSGPGAYTIDDWTRNVLLAQLVLKQLGVSFTANSHRFAVRSPDSGKLQFVAQSS